MSDWQIPISGQALVMGAWPLSTLFEFCVSLFCFIVGVRIFGARQAKITSDQDKFLSRFLENLSDRSIALTYMIDVKEKKITYCNRVMSDFLGFTQSEISAKGHWRLEDWVHPDEVQGWKSHLTALLDLEDGQIVKIEQRVRGADRLWHWILHKESVHSRDPDGTVRTVLGVGRDITNNRQAQDSLRQSHQILEKVIDDSSIGMALVSPTGEWIRVNKPLCDLVGYSEVELKETYFQNIIHPDDLHTDERFIEEMREGTRKSYQMEKRYIKKDGSTVWVILSLTVVRDQNEKPEYFISQVLDISKRTDASLQLERHAKVLESQKSELVFAKNQLEALATTDGLTGVYNRRQFDKELDFHISLARRYGVPLSIILMDIDNFKQVNDQFGHVTGDEVLRRVAALLKAGARDSDFVARYGGEEFAIICPQSDLDSAEFLANRLRQTIHEYVFSCGVLTASFGVASFGGDYLEIKPLVAGADEALYRSKRNGRNQVSVAIDLHELMFQSNEIDPARTFISENEPG